MVNKRLPPQVIAQEISHLLAPFSARTVDDPRSAGLLEHLGNGRLLCRVAECVAHLVAQVGAVKAGDKDPRIGQFKLFTNVATYVVRCGGGKGNGRRLPQLTSRAADSSIVGPKVMAPLANAMRFVHCQQCDTCSGDCLTKSGAAKPLRR